MQELELLLIASGILVAVAWVAVPFVNRAGMDGPVPRLLLGIVPGVIGVLFVIVGRLDILPDDLEGPLWIIGVVMITAIAILGTTYRFARR